MNDVQAGHAAPDMTADRRGGPTRIQIGLWCALVAFTAALALWRFDSHPAISADSAAYTVLAESFFSPAGYGEINDPSGSPPSRFPFVYPLLLTPAVILAPGNFEALRIPSLIATLVNACLLFWGWRWLSKRSYWWGLAVTTLYCLSPNSVVQARLVLSEAVFTTFLLGTVILVEYGVRRPRRWGWYVATGALSFAMVYTRTVGWVMLAGMLAYAFYRWRRRFWVEALRVGVVWLVGYALVLTLTPVEPQDLVSLDYVQRYASEAAHPRSAPLSESQGLTSATGYSLLARLREHLVRDLPSTIVPGLHSDAVAALAQKLRLDPVLPLTAVVIVCLLALGCVRWWRGEGWSAFLMVILPYLIVLIPWTWLGPRLLYPIQPQLSLAFLYGLEGVALFLAHRRRPAAQPAWVRTGLAAAAITLIAIDVAVSVLYPTYHQYDAFLATRSQWLQQHTRPDAILMSNIPATDFLYSRRKGVGYGDSSSVDALWRDVQQAGVDVILVDRISSTWQTAGDGVEVERVYNYRREGQRVLDEVAGLLATGAVVELPVPESYQFRAFEVQQAHF